VQRLGIVGVGLIGGSVARASRAANANLSIVGVDRDGIAEAAAAAGVIDRAATLDELCACDLIVLAAPVSANLAWLDRLAAAGTSALITDVGGTKRQMAVKASALAPGLNFVGGHPMAGSERSGFAAADPGLFRDRLWFLVPSAPPPPGSLDRLNGWVASLGARPMVVDATAHDRVMATVSALPQVTASALMAVVGERVDEEGLAMAGPGLVDTTRLAGSAATWMTDGLAHNAREVGEAIDALIDELRHVRNQLETPERVRSLFERAQDWRRRLLNRHK
jgi:prephenate dehydrogenase